MVVSLHTKKITSLLDRSRGLIGREGTAIFFQTRFGIHTFFLTFPIDVVVMDDSYRVQIVKEALQPNRVFLWNPQWRNIVELPAGTVKKKKIVKGSSIILL